MTSIRLTDPALPEEFGALILQAVQDAADMFFLLDREGRILCGNDAGMRLLADAIGPVGSAGTLRVFDVDPGLTEDGWKAGWARLEGGERLHLETRYRTRDGHERPVAITAHALGQPGRSYACAFVHDITEHRRAQEESREFSQLVSVLFNSAPVAIVALDPDGRVRMWNAAAERMFGWTETEAVGTPLPVIPSGSRAEFDETRLAAQRGASVAGVDREAVGKDGTPLRVRLTMVRWPAADGEVAGVIGLLEDVTEHERLEAQLLQAQRLESVGRLAGAVAHDFNNLLTVINGYTEIALSQLTPRDPLRDSIQEIKSAGDRAAGLTQQLLAFSRRQVLQPKVLDVNAVVSDLEMMLRRLIGEDIELVLLRDAEVGRVKADPVQIQQVLMNLAVNARDAMAQGGKLLIETTNVDLTEEDVRRHPDSQPGRYVMLGVTDTGTGMDEATQSRLFEPFFTTKAPGKGTGLGLATVYGIVKQSGGHIWVYSAVGQGTSFKILLPRADDGLREAPDEEAVRPAGSKGSETVLLVEDQPEVRQLALQVLTMYGYRVLPAPTGAAALEIARTEKGAIDLVLTDVVMPGMGGIDLALALATVRPGARVLFMSGYADNAALQREKVPLGADYLQKPFTPAGLARKVRAVLDGGAAPSDQPARRVLVVDDEVEIRKLLRQFLEAAGYRVAEAAHGRQALMEVDAGDVALVITDLVMPEQEGIETIREIRRRHADVRIVAMSGAFGGRFLRTAEMLGAHATLLKPVRADVLVRTVREVLDQTKS